MPHIRILNIDIELLLKVDINNMNIHRFSSLEILIVRQTNNFIIEEPLAIIARLGVSSSLRTIHLQQYSVNSQSTTDNLILFICQICHNMCKLKVMTIEFSTDALFNNDTFEKFAEIEKKNCLSKFIHVSNAYVELWSAQ